MSELLSEDQAREILIRAIHAKGSAVALAKDAGCAPALVSYALNGQKPIGPKLAKALGLIEIPRVTYQYLKAE